MKPTPLLLVAALAAASAACGNPPVAPPADAAGALPGRDVACNETDGELCARLGKDCDVVTAADRCGVLRSAHCGFCSPPDTCGGAGEDNVCGRPCVSESEAAFCARHGKTCGSFQARDNCGRPRAAECGGCAPGQVCGADNTCRGPAGADAGETEPQGDGGAQVQPEPDGGGTATHPGGDDAGGAQGADAGTCPPETDDELCLRLGKNCGELTADDRCGHPRTVPSCGTCAGGVACPADNVCPGTCEPEPELELCERLGLCGTVTADDNCHRPRTVDCQCCGNGRLDPGERCDGTNAGGESCAGLGYLSGTLSCAADCSALDESGCVEPTLQVQNKTLLWAGALDAWAGFHVSPDGRWLAFTHSPDPDGGGFAVLELLDLQTGATTTLSPRADGWTVAFTEDSRFLYYVHNYRNGWPSEATYELWVKPLPGGAAIPIAAPVHGVPLFTADGNHIVYPVGNDVFSQDLYVASTCCGGATLIDSGVRAWGPLSPGTGFVHYYKGTDGASGTAELWLAAIPAGTTRLLSTTAHFVDGWGMSGYSGEQSFFYLDGYVPGASGTLKVAPTAGGAPVTVVPGVQLHAGNGTALLRFSPDNSHVVYWSAHDPLLDRGPAYVKPMAGGAATLLGNAVGAHWALRPFSYQPAQPEVLFLDAYVPAQGTAPATGVLKLHHTATGVAQTIASGVSTFTLYSLSPRSASYLTGLQANDTGTLHYLDLATGTSTLLGNLAAYYLTHSPDRASALFFTDVVDGSSTCTVNTVSLPSASQRHQVSTGAVCHYASFAGNRNLLYVESLQPGSELGVLKHARLDGSRARVLSSPASLGTIFDDSYSAGGDLVLVQALLDTQSWPRRTRLLAVHPGTGASVEIEPLATPPLGWLDSSPNRVLYTVPDGPSAGIWRADVTY